MFQENVIKGSEQYLRKNAVQNIMQSGNSISADVKGLDDFHVKVETSGDEIAGMECSCPLSKSGQKCKHMAAVLLYADENGLLNKGETIVDENFNVETTDEEPEIPEETEVVVEAEPVAEPEIIIETEPVAEPEIKAEVEPVAESENIANAETVQKTVINAEKEETVTETETDAEKPEVSEAIESEPEPEITPTNEKTEEKVNVTYNVNWPFIKKHDGSINVTADVAPLFAFSLYQNGTLLVDNIVIKNNTENEYKHLVIRCYSDFYFFDMEPFYIASLAPNETYTYKGPTFQINGNALKKLSEKVTCNLYVCITYGVLYYPQSSGYFKPALLCVNLSGKTNRKSIHHRISDRRSEESA